MQIFSKLNYYLTNYFISSLLGALAIGLGAQLAAELFKEPIFWEKEFFEIIIFIDMIAIFIGKIVANYYIEKNLIMLSLIQLLICSIYLFMIIYKLKTYFIYLILQFMEAFLRSYVL